MFTPETLQDECEQSPRTDLRQEAAHLGSPPYMLSRSLSLLLVEITLKSYFA